MNIKPRVMRFHDGTRFATAILCSSQRKYATLVVCGDATVVRIPLEDIDVHTRDIEYKSRPYPLNKAIQAARRQARYRNAGKLPQRVKLQLRLAETA